MLLCLTANHQDTDFDVLDRVSRAVDRSTPAAFARDERVRGAVLVSTCNRFEVYLDVDEPPRDPRSIVADALGGSDDATALADAVTPLADDDAVRHLFAVTSGMKSMVVGEGEIAGQVQRSLTTARAAGLATPELEQAFQRAASASRAVRARVDVAAGRS